MEAAADIPWAASPQSTFGGELTRVEAAETTAQRLLIHPEPMLRDEVRLRSSFEAAPLTRHLLSHAQLVTRIPDSNTPRALGIEIFTAVPEGP